MDIVVKGRNVEVPDHYRVHVAEKLARLERYDRKVIRFDVELFHEPNRRQSKNCQRVEITGKGRGPVVRSEACAGDFYAALARGAALAVVASAVGGVPAQRQFFLGGPHSIRGPDAGAFKVGAKLRHGARQQVRALRAFQIARNMQPHCLGAQGRAQCANTRASACEHMSAGAPSRPHPRAW